MTQIQITACKASADAALQCPGIKIVRHLENSMALAFKALRTLVEERRRMEWERGQGVPFQSLKIDDPPVPFKAWSGLVCFHPAFLIDFGYFQGNVPCAWIQANRVQIQLFHPPQGGWLESAWPLSGECPCLTDGTHCPTQPAPRFALVYRVKSMPALFGARQHR